MPHRHDTERRPVTTTRQTPIPGSGICSRCQTHTNNGLVYPIDGATGAGGRTVYCADRQECTNRKRA